MNWLLTNPKNKEKKLFKKSIKTSGFEGIVFIKDDAIGPNGKVLKGHFGLYTKERGKHVLKFWEQVDKYRICK